MEIGCNGREPRGQRYMADGRQRTLSQFLAVWQCGHRRGKRHPGTVGRWSSVASASLQASEADTVEPQGLPFREGLIGLCGEA